MPTSATQTESLQFTPPGGSAQTVSHNATVSHSARSAGTLAIAATTADDTAQDLPPGPYRKLVIFNRLNGQNITVTLNSEDVLQLPPGGEISVNMPAAPGGTPISTAAIANVGQQATNAEVDFLVFV